MTIGSTCRCQAKLVGLRKAEHRLKYDDREVNAAFADAIARMPAPLPAHE